MKRNIQIDFLRFCAVLLVILRHFKEVQGNTFFGKLFNTFIVGGWIGVDLFFVVSGYLITSLILKEYDKTSTFSAKNFLIRRGFKIYPLYYLLIFTDFTISKLQGNQQSIRGLINEALFIANYGKYNNIILWSISVEEQFYLLLALSVPILIKFNKFNLKFFTVFYCAAAIITLAFRISNYFIYDSPDFVRDFTRTHIRIDALLFGSLISFLTIQQPKLILRVLGKKYILFPLCIIILSLNFLFKLEVHQFVSVVFLLLNPICFGYLLVIMINSKSLEKNIIVQKLGIIGKYSYSIYLFHIIFRDMYISSFPTYGFSYYICRISLMLFGGILISKLLEYPILNFRNRYFPSKV